MKRLVLAVSVIAATLVAAQAAGGGTSTVHVSGTYTVTDLGALTCAPNGSPFVFRCSTAGLVSQYSGSLTGTSVADFVEIIDCKKGRALGHGTETLTGSVESVGSGTLTWRIHFMSAFDCSTFAVSDFSGSGVVTTGTGDLSGLNGSILFGDVTYEGVLH